MRSMAPLKLQAITPCGLLDKEVTSIAELATGITLRDVKNDFTSEFAASFSVELVAADAAELAALPATSSSRLNRIT